MDIGHHACDPTRVEIFPAWPCLTCLAFVNIALHGRLPEALIARVDGELGRRSGYLNVRVCQDEISDLTIQSESVCPPANG